MEKYILLLLLTTNLLLGQEPFMFQFTDENGLSSMTVYQILQDQQGYIWIGSAKGLSRYDGRSFVHIDVTKLLDREIIYLDEDHLGRIWINNLSGQIAWVEDLNLQLLEFEDVSEDYLPMRFSMQDSMAYVIYKDNKRPRSVLQFEITSTLDKENLMFIESDDFLSGFSYSNYNGHVYMSFIGIQNDTICFVGLSNNNVSTECFEIYNGRKLENSTSYKLKYIDDRGRFYISNNLMVLRYDKTSRTLDYIYDCTENQVNKCFTINGQIWLLTKTGIIILNSETFAVENVLLEGKNTNTLFKDRENNYWIATASDGIYLMYNTDPLTYNLRNSQLPKSDIHCLYHDPTSKSLYIGMSNGYMSKFDYDKGEFFNYKLPLSGRVVSIMKDHKDQIWMGLDDGVCKYDPKTEKIENKNITNASKVLFEDAENSIWYGTSGILYKWDATLDESDSSPKFYAILSKRISAVMEDYDSNIWVGTIDGIYVNHTDSLLPIDLDKEGKEFSITDIAQTQDSTIWVATANEGLVKIRGNNVEQFYWTQHGLASNNCLSLHAIENDLIVGTDNGLSIINIQTNEISQVYHRDGLPSREINCVASDGKMIWMGTPKGLVVLDREKIFRERNTPEISISKLKINGNSHPLENAISLAHHQNTVDLEYIGLDIKSNQNESYAYRLKGLNDEWLSTTSRIARFHTLQPGKYTFEVKTVNDIGIESADPAVYQFSINRPWWNTIWFFLTSGFLTLSVLGSGIYWRVNEKRKRAKMERDLQERIQHLKSESLKSQMNPHFIYNSLNAIQDFFITNDEESALLYLSKFAQMIRQIFDYSSRELITLQEEMEFLSLYLDLEKLRFGDRVEVEFKIEQELEMDASGYEIPPLLLQPVVENAFKHGLLHKLEGGKILVNIAKEEDHIKCIIEDNGIGRRAAYSLKSPRQKRRNYGGLQAVKERLTIWSKDSNIESFSIVDLEDSNHGALGTQIIIRL